jgi:O-antigen ligase
LNVLVGSPRQFPHNIVLETWLEGGWLAGITLVALLCVALLRLGLLSRLRTLRPESGVLAAMFVFLLLNDLVSGELNDSKVLFAVMAIALSFPGTLNTGEPYRHGGNDAVRSAPLKSVTLS